MEELLINLLGEMEITFSEHGTEKTIYKGIIVKICNDGGVVCLISEIIKKKNDETTCVLIVKQLKHIAAPYIEDIKFKHNNGGFTQYKLCQKAKKPLNNDKDVHIK